MITVTRLEDLGHFRNDWLEARYHFSFSSYQDPARMGWGALRVWNDDTIQPGGRRAYLVPARGRIEINGWEASERAGAQVADEEQIVIKALTDAEVVLVDVA